MSYLPSCQLLLRRAALFVVGVLLFPLPASAVLPESKDDDELATGRFILRGASGDIRITAAETDTAIVRDRSGQDISRGYEIGKGQYILVDDEELEKIQIESTHTIDIDTFVPKPEVDERFLENPYYLVPTDKVGQEPFAVIRDAIRDMNMAALGRVVLSRRERVIMLEPFERGLLGMTLRYPYEVRKEDAYFDDIADVKLPAEMRELAAHIVKTKSGHFDPSKFEDHYETALIELLRRKQEGKRIEPIREAPRPSNVVNLMDALRKSVQAEGGEAPPARSRTAAGERRRSPARTRKSSGRPRKAG